MSAHRTYQTVLVAVPYYGTLTLPPLGLSRLFFVATVDIAARKAISIELQVWDPKKEANLSVWLRGLGVSGVMCSDSRSPYEIALNAENIWVLWNQEGEANELVERWARGEIDPDDTGRKDEQKQKSSDRARYGMSLELDFSPAG
ncbi:MAG TPA: hypothetical protein VIH45_05880 [Desulfuromonadaceae bacterium]